MFKRLKREMNRQNKSLNYLFGKNCMKPIDAMELH